MKINGAFVLVKIGQDHPPSIRRSDAFIFITIFVQTECFGSQFGIYPFPQRDLV
jgi:hypothetical protein